MKQPWMIKPLDEWDIVGMNHYHHGDQRMLFVAMIKDDSFIKEEGPDDEYIWNRLWHKAAKAMEHILPNV
jgi:hypothetical protein